MKKRLIVAAALATCLSGYAHDARAYATMKLGTPRAVEYALAACHTILINNGYPRIDRLHDAALVYCLGRFHLPAPYMFEAEIPPSVDLPSTPAEAANACERWAKRRLPLDHVSGKARPAALDGQNMLEQYCIDRELRGNLLQR